MCPYVLSAAEESLHHAVTAVRRLLVEFVLVVESLRCSSAFVLVVVGRVGAGGRAGGAATASSAAVAEVKRRKKTAAATPRLLTRPFLHGRSMLMKNAALATVCSLTPI